MNTARIRLGALIAAAMCLLAVLIVGDAAAQRDLDVTPAASVEVAAEDTPTRSVIDSPLTICNRWRPHGTSDHVYTADTYKMTSTYIDTQCIANHPGTNHYYCVTTWWNDAETWRHPCFDGL